MFLSQHFIDSLSTKERKTIFFTLLLKNKSQNKTNNNIVIDKEFIQDSTLNNTSISLYELNNNEKSISFKIFKSFLTGNNMLLSDLFDLQVNILCNITVNQKTVSNVIYRGFISNVLDVEMNTFDININSILMKLKKLNGDFFSPLCRAQLGDAKCKVDLEKLKISGSIIAIENNNIIFGNHNAIENSNYFDRGKIVLHMAQGQIICDILYEKDRYIHLINSNHVMQIGDNYDLLPNCDKTIKNCQQKFNNIFNFRGEPFIS